MESLSVIEQPSFTSFPDEIIVAILEVIDCSILYSTMILTCKTVSRIAESKFFIGRLLEKQFGMTKKAVEIASALGPKCTLIMKHRACTVLKNLVTKRNILPYSVAFSACIHLKDWNTTVLEELAEIDDNRLRKYLASLSHMGARLDHIVYHIPPSSYIAWRKPIVDCIRYLSKDVKGDPFSMREIAKGDPFFVRENAKTDPYAAQPTEDQEYYADIILSTIRYCLIRLGKWTEMDEISLVDFREEKTRRDEERQLINMRKRTSMKTLDSSTNITKRRKRH